ncbi:hypothetical protein OIO07_11810 [Bacillus paralicheniformis]|uniref:hypothetical protein n=1 Tax=Bacillus subtilis group TaxID=653685 RepID=UPI0012FA5591|nr:MULTISPECIES: hypothetical protein [Bacillus subtilis group]MCA1183479.1 hypothetical protein [Bacillus licheniformis]MCV9368926.1 hypothetical protein [Bacillus paralicheniformis]MCY7740858.1 hypothetical protein [Bacillus licheniformis]MDH3162298.1 hypothetical protein [Bacillus licheniformis]TWK98011.1 hypothetical protein CHCC20327_2807 [Bacillus licheniformis]
MKLVIHFLLNLLLGVFYFYIAKPVSSFEVMIVSLVFINGFAWGVNAAIKEKGRK